MLLLLFGLAPMVIFLVALWRIGTGTLQTAEATREVARAQLQTAKVLAEPGGGQPDQPLAWQRV